MFSCVLCSIIVLSYEQIVCKTRKQETADFTNVCSSGSSSLPQFKQKSGGQLLTKLHQEESQATSLMLFCFMEFFLQILTLKTDLQCWPFWLRLSSASVMSDGVPTFFVALCSVGGTLSVLINFPVYCISSVNLPLWQYLVLLFSQYFAVRASRMPIFMGSCRCCWPLERILNKRKRRGTYLIFDLYRAFF